jgi:hypothetical protein
MPTDSDGEDGGSSPVSYTLGEGTPRVGLAVCARARHFIDTHLYPRFCQLAFDDAASSTARPFEGGGEETGSYTGSGGIGGGGRGSSFVERRDPGSAPAANSEIRGAGDGGSGGSGVSSGGWPVFTRVPSRPLLDFDGLGSGSVHGSASGSSGSGGGGSGEAWCYLTLCSCTHTLLLLLLLVPMPNAST